MRVTSTIVLSSLLWTLASSARGDLVINEVLSRNSSVLADDDGDFSDWLELYNRGDAPVSLEGLSITDDPASATPWPLPPTTIAPGSFLLVWASAKDRRDVAEPHTDFRLDGDEEVLILRGSAGEELDRVEFANQRRDTSWGRAPDGGADWRWFLEPTPGGENETTAYAERPSDTVAFSPEGGRHRGIVVVSLSVFPPDAVIYYSVDGSTPGPLARRYVSPFVVTDTVVIRSTAYLRGRPLTEPTARTYLVNEPRGLQVLSITADPVDLHSPDRGILANPTATGEEWERPAHIELYDTDGRRVLGAGCGLRVHGGASRVNSDKLSLRLYFRDEYGPRRLRHRFFADESGEWPLARPAVDEFDKLVLRGGYNDSWTHFSELLRTHATFVRDEVVRRLHLRMGALGAHGTWVSLWLNGSYYGLFNLTERIDDEFLSSYIPHPEWDVIKEGLVREGDAVAWSELLSFVRRSNLADPAAWAELERRVDIDQLASYLALSTWADNRDWPQRNWYAVRERGVPDARWRFLQWDSEQTFSASTETLETSHATLDDARRVNGDLAVIIDSVLRSPEFRRVLARELERHLRGALDPPAARALIEEEADRIAAEIPLEAARWGGGTPEGWRDAVERTLEFVERRRAGLQATIASLEATGVEDVFPPPSPLPGRKRVALLVAEPSQLTAGDVAIRDRLRQRNALVDVLDSATDDPNSVTLSYDLVLVSSSAPAGEVTNDYARRPIPCIFWQPALVAPAWEPLADSARVEPPSQRLRFRDISHPILEGLRRSVLVEVTTAPARLAFASGAVGADVSVLAEGASADLSAVLVVPAGGQLRGGVTAAARTVFLPLGADGLALARGPLVRLFDQSVNWAMGLANPPSGALLLRGDVNEDDFVDLSDAIAAVRWLFGGSGEPRCADAIDVDDDGVAGVTDVVRLLDFLFRLGPPPRLPWPHRGEDPTPDDLGCASVGD